MKGRCMIMKKMIFFSCVLVFLGLLSWFLVNSFLLEEEREIGRLTNLQAARALEEKEIAVINSFATQMYENLAEEENLFFSPLSIYMALGMTYNGADGTTQSEFEAVLGDDVALNELNRELQYRVLGYEEIDFELANSLWIRDSYREQVLDTFLETNQEYYGAKVSYLDFDQPASVDAINDWVAETTEGLIDEAVEEIDPLAVMFLINTIYFQGDWLNQFEEEETYKSDFMIDEDDLVEVDMMRQINNFDYYEDDEIQFILLPYEGEETAMFVALPSEGEEFDFARIDDYVQSAQENATSVDFHMPRTEISFRSSLKETLKEMGLVAAFSETDADFSNMAQDAREAGLHIHDVIHEAVLIIDEVGTEAAAMTSVEMRVESVPHAEKEMKVNRPYNVGIIDFETNAIMFTGRVDNPMSE